ncbi:methylenetetrahydrofolate reductase C-terminal domain-containing protein [Chloroflexota bacterium]
MIVAEQKPLDEIRKMITPYERVLLLGCGTCVTVCNAGGEREVSFLRNALQLAQTRSEDGDHAFTEYTLKRQCDVEFFDTLVGRIEEIDAVLSLACGIGIQAVAERFPDLPVLPGVNTTMMGVTRGLGVWDECCAACGECHLEETGGICPITRCTKGILNGPCAGTKNGKCEANKEMDCAWVAIYQRLERLGQLDKMRRYYPPHNFGTILRPKRIMIKASLESGEANG